MIIGRACSDKVFEGTGGACSLPIWAFLCFPCVSRAYYGERPVEGIRNGIEINPVLR